MEKGNLPDKNFLNKFNFAPVDEVTFILDKNNKFVASLHEPVEELILISGGILMWHSSTCQSIKLVDAYEYSLFDAFVDLYRHLREMINKNFEEPSIDSDKELGYIWNLICFGDPLVKNENEDFFYSRKIWSCRDTDTWLYIQDGIIFLEITPSYTWTPETQASEEEDTLQTFRERMKSYKPIAKFVLSREVAEQWYKQAKELVEIIYRNFERDGGPHVDIKTEV